MMLPIKGCKSVACAFLLSICTSNICKRVWSCLPLAIFVCTWPSFLLAETVIFSYFPLSLSVPDSLLSSQSPRDKTRVTAWFFCFTVLVLGRNAFIHFSLNATLNLADIYNIYIYTHVFWMERIPGKALSQSAEVRPWSSANCAGHQTLPLAHFDAFWYQCGMVDIVGRSLVQLQFKAWSGIVPFPFRWSNLWHLEALVGLSLRLCMLWIRVTLHSLHWPAINTWPAQTFKHASKINDTDSECL